MVRHFNEFKIGYSPDGLVDDDGLIEIKSRDQKTHLKTILTDAVPAVEPRTDSGRAARFRPGLE